MLGYLDLLFAVLQSLKCSLTTEFDCLLQNFKRCFFVELLTSNLPLFYTLYNFDKVFAKKVTKFGHKGKGCQVSGTMAYAHCRQNIYQNGNVCISHLINLLQNTLTYPV